MSRQTLVLGAAVADSVLAADLVDADGHVLLPAGSRISLELIASLMLRGVQTVEVDRADPLAEMAGREAQVRQQVAHLFRHAGSNPAADRLREVVVDYRLTAAAPEGPP